MLRLLAWAAATVVLALLIELAEGTDDGLREDVADVVTLVPLAVRQLVLAGAQIVAVLVPTIVVVLLVAQRRWRRTALLALAVALAVLVSIALERLLDTGAAVPGSLASDSWLISTRFPSIHYLTAAAAATILGTPWLSSAWRRSVARRGLLGLVIALLVAGTSSPTALLLANVVRAPRWAPHCSWSSAHRTAARAPPPSQLR